MYIYLAKTAAAQNAATRIANVLLPLATLKQSRRFGLALLQIATLGFLAAASAAPAQAFDFSRSMDRGGRIGDYMERIVSEAGRAHVIDGDCMSACTMWLGHRGTCVTPNAVLYFHSASDSAQAMRSGNPWRSISSAGNRALLAMYPSRVRAVVAPWLESPEFHTLTGAQLAALGVRMCKSREVASF